MILTLEERWQRFRNVALSNLNDVEDSVQLAEMRKGYFSGCLEMVAAHFELAALPDREANEALDALHREAAAFGQSMVTLDAAMNGKKNG